jgi:hypothetical protein
MNRCPATKRLGSLYGVATLGIEFEIGREGLIGQKANLRAPRLKGATLGMVKQEAPEPPALPFRRNRNVLDPQMIGSEDHLDKACKRAVSDQKVNRVLGDRALIFGLHRQRLASDQRDPFGVGCARQIADRLGIRWSGGPNTGGSEASSHLEWISSGSPQSAA